MAISTIPKYTDSVEDIKDELTLTPGSKAGSGNISGAKKSGNIIQIRGTVTTNASVSAGSNIEISISGVDVLIGGYVGYFFVDTVMGLIGHAGGSNFILKPLTANVASGKTCTFTMMFIGEKTS